MSNMTEYELLTQGACHCLTPAYDGRDPMRNRPHSNGTDTTMMIRRYGLGREYAGNTGSPAITEQADGAYVRYEDHQRMEAAHKAHNEMLVLRTKKAESAQPSERTNRDYAIEHAEYLAKAAERFIEAVCSHSQAVMEHDEQDTLETAKAADDAAESTGEAMTALRSRIYGFRSRRDRATAPAGGQAQQDADKVDAQPAVAVPMCHKCGTPMVRNPHPDAGRMDRMLEVGCPMECLPCTVLSRHQWAGRAMAAETELRKAKPDPAMAGDAALLDMLETLCNGLEWNIENHPEVMNESDAEALAQARSLLKRVQPASGEDAK